MRFSVATHNTAKGSADFGDFADIVVRQEMWAWRSRRRLRKSDGDDRRSWWPRPHFGTTITFRRGWTRTGGGSWRAHRGFLFVTPARGPVLAQLESGIEVAAFGVHYINGARHNRFKFARTLTMRIKRWGRFHATLLEQVARVRREHPGAYIVIAGDFNADDHLMPDIPGFKRVGHRIDWIYYDDRLDLVGFDRLGSHGSDHPVLRAAFRTPDETPEVVPMDRFVTKEQWGHNPSKEATEDSHPIGATEGISAHWEGAYVGTEPHSACAQRVRNIERSHEYGRGWGDIAYNLLVCQHGYVFEGRGAGVRSAANGYTAANDSHYAVCALMGPGDAFTEGFRAGFLAAFDYLEREGNAGPERNGHRDHKATQCPGPDIYRWVSNLPPGAARPTKEDDMAWDHEYEAWGPDKNPDGPMPMDQQLQQARGYAADAWRRTRRIEKAIEALAKALGPTVEKAVTDALAESVVDVEVTVRDDTA